jgi:LmbE family N-acetylglucosaminyl deacetylase
MNKVLVVAVHPDDETLGCGGTLLKHISDGDEINWLICTRMDKNQYQDEEIKIRNMQINSVSNKYCFNSVESLGLYATQVDKYDQNYIIKLVNKVINKIKPNIIYLPFYNDVHSDHRIIFDVFYSCTKSFRNKFLKKLYMMETLSETEFSFPVQSHFFVPNVYVDIGDYFQKKLEIFKIYESEVQSIPGPRSLKNIESLARYRGSVAGCEYAESFMLLKEIR